MLRSPPFCRASRWLAPWAMVFALSCMIAYAATTALAITLAGESSPSVAVGAPSKSPDEDAAARIARTRFANSYGLVMRVTCPDDPGFSADARVDSVQALDVLAEGNCEMRLPESG